MKQFIQLGLFAAAMLCGSVVAQAQKIGYLNSAALLAEVPEVKKADANLSALQKQMQKQGEGMAQRMQAKYQAALEKGDKLSKAEQEQVGKELQVAQSELAKFEEKMQRDLGTKREALLSPILKRVDDAIKAVAKEKGYKMIFDSSTGAIVYADGDDITVFVKAKLGMAATPGKAPATVVSPSAPKGKR
jgi:outer membrane protein